MHKHAIIHNSYTFHSFILLNIPIDISKIFNMYGIKCLTIHALYCSKQTLLCCFPAAPVGGTLTGRQSSTGGGVRCLGDSYYMSADVSQFEPHDVVVMAYNHHVVIHAQKVCVYA